MNHADLVAFLRRAHAALREDDEDRQSYIFVKENCCDDGPGGIPQEFMDEEDSSLTRYVRVSFRYEIFGLRCFSVSFCVSGVSFFFFAFSAVSRRRLFSSPAIGYPFSVRLPTSIVFSIPRGMTLKTIFKRQRQKDAEADHSLFRFFSVQQVKCQVATSVCRCWSQGYQGGDTGRNARRAVRC